MKEIRQSHKLRALLFVALALLIGRFIFASNPEEPTTFGVTTKIENEVYVCVSPNAYAYHNRYCQGLNQCTHDVDTISVAEAINMGRRACGYCF